jgi:hypothetical protein
MTELLAQLCFSDAQIRTLRRSDRVREAVLHFNDKYNTKNGPLSYEAEPPPQSLCSLLRGYDEAINPNNSPLLKVRIEEFNGVVLNALINLCALGPAMAKRAIEVRAEYSG